MFQNDYVMRQIELLSKGLAKMLFQKDTGSEETVDEQGFVNEGMLYKKLLTGMMEAGQLGEAEDYLYEVLEQNSGPLFLGLALWFYEQLSALSDEALEAADYSRDEIAQGLKDVARYFPEGSVEPA